mgnify:CR=1 FL=1
MSFGLSKRAGAGDHLGEVEGEDAELCVQGRLEQLDVGLHALRQAPGGVHVVPGHVEAQERVEVGPPGAAQRALVIGAETFSRILDWEDRATCVLFGDGAGAVVLGAEESADGQRGILAAKLHADGRHNQLLYVDGGPSTTGTVGKLRMKGQEVFRHAVVNLASVLNEVMSLAGLDARDIESHMAKRDARRERRCDLTCRWLNARFAGLYENFSHHTGHCYGEKENAEEAEFEEKKDKHLHRSSMRKVFCLLL